jgi:hypothetical protein
LRSNRIGGILPSIPFGCFNQHSRSTLAVKREPRAERGRPIGLHPTPERQMGSVGDTTFLDRFVSVISIKQLTDSIRSHKETFDDDPANP